MAVNMFILLPALYLIFFSYLIPLAAMSRAVGDNMGDVSDHFNHVNFLLLLELLLARDGKTKTASQDCIEFRLYL